MLKNNDWINDIVLGDTCFIIFSGYTSNGDKILKCIVHKITPTMIIVHNLSNSDAIYRISKKTLMQVGSSNDYHSPTIQQDSKKLEDEYQIQRLTKIARYYLRKIEQTLPQDPKSLKEIVEILKPFTMKKVI